MNDGNVTQVLDDIRDCGRHGYDPDYLSGVIDQLKLRLTTAHGAIDEVAELLEDLLEDDDGWGRVPSAMRARVQRTYDVLLDELHGPPIGD